MTKPLDATAKDLEQDAKIEALARDLASLKQAVGQTITGVSATVTGLVGRVNKLEIPPTRPKSFLDRLLDR